MRITAVDPFYFKMPEITAAADGTQDTLLVRVRTDEGIEGWGECDASPLVSLAAYCCPMSHGNIINIRESILGERLESLADIERLYRKALRQGLDIQQIQHAYSGTDIALWDALGKKLRRPVYRLLGDRRAFPKRAYASVLFGDTPEQTRRRAEELRQAGFKAAKFGWGPFGQAGPKEDAQLVQAAREGIGEGMELMVDAGVAWGSDVERALERAHLLARFDLTWLEEPFAPDAIRAYAELRERKPPVPIAAGENSASYRAAEDYLDHAGLSFIQIDAGRIGGITTARKVCLAARERSVQYVNHTFKSKLSLAAALHVFAGIEPFGYLEYPAAGSLLSERVSAANLEREPSGNVQLSDAPGLGVKVNLESVWEYLVPLEIRLGEQELYSAASLRALSGP